VRGRSCTTRPASPERGGRVLPDLPADGVSPTRGRNIRIDDELWEAAKAAAEAEGRTVADVVRAALKRLVAAGTTEATWPQSPSPKPEVKP